MAFLEKQGRFIYYLVTKPLYNKKPTLKSLESSLLHMRDHSVRNGVKYIGMPCIGSGLDRLEWEDVKAMLVRIFRETEVQIMVYWGW